jgi:hypothetical protein
VSAWPQTHFLCFLLPPASLADPKWVFFKSKKAMIDVPANLTVARDKKQNDLAD